LDIAALLAETEQWREVYEKLVMEYDAETERLREALREILELDSDECPEIWATAERALRASEEER
jgi:hypothetical protein